MHVRRVDTDGWNSAMTLRLALLNADRLPDGGSVSVEVKERGLDIGRLEGLGWTLPDPSRHVSGRHCEIRFAEGGYWLRDISTNGTFINGARTRVEGVRLLHDGDRLAIGPYLIAVEVQSGATDATVVNLKGPEIPSEASSPHAKGAKPDSVGAGRAPTRKLAAILAMDVVGFTRLASADEDRTLARLRALRSDLIEPAIAVHDGRLFKRTGDGALAEFRSAVSAVRCGVEVQNGMRERNAGVAEDRRIELRIGVHIGDVIEESDGDLMGDGVNIAARLEGVAKPGAICLSEDVYRQVRGRVRLHLLRSRPDGAQERRRAPPRLRDRNGQARARRHEVADAGAGHRRRPEASIARVRQVSGRRRRCDRRRRDPRWRGLRDPRATHGCAASRR